MMIVFSYVELYSSKLSKFVCWNVKILIANQNSIVPSVKNNIFIDLSAFRISPLILKHWNHSFPLVFFSHYVQFDGSFPLMSLIIYFFWCRLKTRRKKKNKTKDKTAGKICWKFTDMTAFRHCVVVLCVTEYVWGPCYSQWEMPEAQALKSTVQQFK